MTQWWSWCLDGLGLTCTYLVGRKFWWGWLCYQGYNGIWIAYAITTRQWGFIPGCLVYATLNHKNMKAWRKET